MYLGQFKNNVLWLTTLLDAALRMDVFDTGMQCKCDGLDTCGVTLGSRSVLTHSGYEGESTCKGDETEELRKVPRPMWKRVSDTAKWQEAKDAWFCSQNGVIAFSILVELKQAELDIHLRLDKKLSFLILWFTGWCFKYNVNLRRIFPFGKALLRTRWF